MKISYLLTEEEAAVVEALREKKNAERRQAQILYHVMATALDYIEYMNRTRREMNYSDFIAHDGFNYENRSTEEIFPTRADVYSMVAGAITTMRATIAKKP